MAITFTLNGQAVNDQTTGLQTGDNIDDAFTDTDVAYSSLPASVRTYLEATLGLNSAFPTSVGVATKTNSVTVNATAGSQLTGTTFTDGSGGALNGDDSGLNTVDGKDILLFADGNDTVIGKYDSDGIGGVDTVAFVIFKQDVINAGATSDQVTFHIVTYVPIFHNGSTNPDDAVDLGNTLKLAASETLNFGFAGAPSGSNLFMTFGDPNSTQIVVIGKDPLNQSNGGNITTKDVLNISQAGSTTSFGVNGNQINPDEGAFITYVSGTNTNFLVPNLDQNEADVEANIAFQNVVNATGASFTVNQTNPGVGPVTVKISAFSTAAEPGAGFVDGLTNDTHVAITSFSLTNVVVKTGNTQFTPEASIDADGNLIITGLSSGDKVEWTTSATHNRVLIENISNADGAAGNDNNTFDIGGFGIVTSSGASEFVGQQIVIEDDGPTAGIVQGAPTVAHDETAGNQGDADDTTAAGVAVLFAGVSNVSTDLSPAGYAQDASPVVSSTGSSTGTDGGTTAFSLAVSVAGVDSGLDTTNGTSILLFKEGDLVVGRIGSAAGAAAFAVAINSTSGVVSVAQYASLKHPGTANPDDSVSITDGALLAVVTVTDGDGDTATNSTGIGDAVQFQDDGPAIGLISDGLVDFAAGSTVTKTLSGVVGADDPATYSITASPATLTILDGTSSQVTLLRDLTNSNTVATYFKDVDGSGTHTAGDIDFFKLTLSGGNYTFDVLQNPPPADLNFSFAGAPSGSNLFMTFGDPNSTQIVVIGEDPLNQSNGGNITTKDVLNISQAGSTTSFGVNGNQINPDEGAFITYVTGTNTNFLVPNLDQNEADVEANIAFQNVFNANKASFTVNQTNPGVGPVTVKISAFSTAAEPGAGFVDGLTNDTHVAITSFSLTNVVVKTGNTQFTPEASIDADGNLIITGLSSGDKVEWTTSATHDRVLIENISNADGIAGNDNNTFDIGGFGLSQTQPAPDEKLEFTVQITDADGDTASDSFSIGIDGTGIFDDNHVDGVVIA
ncbi:hypothetical protein D3227_05440 [Mesorhizobium waimense]|uniref:DUF5801 domain-containing protein n=1 Tax=Mesorhizobium waimense TaxID=1300307 RepID=A0A3A5L171_9HYPH|nr:DUF5801 repeats-in-toxin domain-containing protein [Mesorhizobium waimense]RJT41254.1 hypothetical protein D3227_05440 [Mesorhizobium waimense]